MRAARRIAFIPLLALAGTSCSAGNSHVGFDEGADASSASDAGAFSSGASGDSSTFTADVGSPPSPPPPAYDSSAPPPALDSGPPVPCNTPLIDDMEHAGGSILNDCGRQGYWYTYNDGTAAGAQTPVASAAFTPSEIQGGRALGDGGASAHAARTYGSGFTTWGAGMAFDLNSPGAGAKLPYDASNYSGITFWARAETGAQTSLRVNVAEVATDPVGNVCAPKCNDHFGKMLSLTTSWVEYTLSFSQLAQSNWGTVATFDKATLLGVQFQVGAGATFDVWIDDIAFVQ